jgi:GNAT superfamily N-acetyltransferase
MRSTPIAPIAADAAGNERSVDSQQRSEQPVIRAAQVQDVPTLLELFAELAEYEHLEHELHATEELLAEALFGSRPAAQALIAERWPSADDQPEVLGYALFFPTFSSFLASEGVWLEDLFVRPDHRGGGVGKALLAAVAARVRESGGERLEWSALDWNELALGFYRRLGAETMDEWITHRLDGEALVHVAGVSADRPVEEHR